ncbi:hypothetical protein CONLIGDRAFT_648771 [Coniochaeta ligniaria NRRL 30616]|uniref:Uncharacterized protein n=1 Tax=Coniochaeta ligniaria NRRL 30616 TaxID=1408157 RepID=A0A1J7IAC6_9PEZI|nr:hypothetical protein CONLIGDRAFT_648771 [Coniochaeta ligniaria NRRL 30616]
MFSVVGALVRRSCDAVSRFFRSIYLSLELLTRPVVEQGGQQTVSAPSPAALTDPGISTYEQIALHYIERFANGIIFIAEFSVKLFTLLGKYFALAFRAVYVFCYYLLQYANWDGKDVVREWVIFRDLPNMHIDRHYLWAVVCSPSMGLRDHRRWQRRRGIRWARPKIRTHVDVEERDPEETLRMIQRNAAKAQRRGGPFLGQQNPFEYVSDDEGNWEGKGKGKKEDVVETEHREGQSEPREPQPEPEAIKGPSIGRKEAKRGTKKRKPKR